MTTYLFVIANVKQLRTGSSFRILLPFFRTTWGVGVLNSAVFNSFHNQVEFGTIFGGLRMGGGGFNPSSVCQRFLFKYLYTVPRLVSGIYISKSYKNK